MGRALLGLGHYDEAVHQFQWAIDLGLNEAETYYLMGFALEQENEIGGAIEELKKAIALAPEVPDFHQALSGALLRQSKIPEANEEIEKAHQLK